MSPGRRGSGESGPADRASLDELRARMEAAAARGPRPKRRGRRFGDDPPPDGFDEPVPEAPTPLEEDATDRSLGGRWWDDHPGKPIPVTDGIAASTRRGPIGATWWSRRFLASLEAVLVGGRMERGRSYARKGQVVSLTVDAGVIAAVVQGSRPEPYGVRLRMQAATDEEWERIIVELGCQARYAARLLAGDLPREVETVFDATGASLFPGPQSRLVTECTCPDFENPCKHIAAVCYLVAEMFDRDPFQVLAWRGRDRGALVDALRHLRRAPASSEERGGSEQGAARSEGVPAATPGVPAEGFWAAGPGLAGVHIRPVASPVPGAILRQLASGLLTVKGVDIAEVLGAAYEAFAAAAQPDA